MIMSSWYTRAELAHRIAWFYSGSSLANSFGGLIGAGVLGNLHGAHGISGWRWLFIIEGVITVAVAAVAAVVLPNYPSTTSWLTQGERDYAQWRLIEDAGEDDLAESSTVLDGVKLAFTDPKLYLFALFQHVSLLSQTFQYFFPTIVKTLGYNNIATLFITAPVWIGTFFVSLIVTYTSGRYNDRSIHIICLMIISVVGNAIATGTMNLGARFFAMFLMPMGAVSAYQIILAWIANSFPRPLVKRSAAISFCNMIGNTANIYGPCT
jgi:predicted MFS family arabinose efflux permease